MVHDFKHYSVMAHEATSALNYINSDKLFIDATLGGAGHSALIASGLNEKGTLLSFDVDIDAIEKSREVLSNFKNVKIIHDSYMNLENYLQKYGFSKITGGILFDLGASYHQLTSFERGFSFIHDAPLDMRFNQNGDISAYDIVNKYKEGDLVRIFSTYGEERFSKRIAHAIVNSRPLNTTLQLVDVIKKSTPKIKSRIHPATRVFQALRIEVNQELVNFEKILNKIVYLSDSNAIISVISFHSLEDRIVKNIFKKFSRNGENKMLELVTKKPIMASDKEISENPPSRSAKLRIARKI